MRDAIDDGAAVDVADVHGAFFSGVGLRGDVWQHKRECVDGVDAFVMFAAGVCGFACGGELPGAAAFARGDDVPAAFIDGAAFKDEHGACFACAALNRSVAKIIAGDFLGGVGGDEPVGLRIDRARWPCYKVPTPGLS